MNLPLLLLISFPLLLATETKKWRIKSLFTKEDYDKKWIKSLFTKEDYDKIESSARLTFNPTQKCPCGKYYLGEMELAYFQWIHPETHKIQLARYLISKRLFASGRVGVLFHATMISYPENDPHKCVAIKMAKDGANETRYAAEKNMEIIEREINVIKSFRMTNHSVGYGPRHYLMPNKKPIANAIVMEIGHSFENYWAKREDNNKKYIEKKMLKILKQILMGIEEIHQRNFVHLDLKAANVLITPSNNDNEFYLKLIDFGGAIKLKNGKRRKLNKDLVITQQCTAPEIYIPKFVENKHYIMISKKADIWSFGMLILEMFAYIPTLENNQNPFKFFKFDAAKYLSNKNKKFKKAIINLKSLILKRRFEEKLNKFLAITEKNFPRVSAILESCLKWDPKRRSMPAELIKFYFKDISTTADIAEMLKKEQFKDISTTEETAKSDFFGEMTKYLDEQFKNISLTFEKDGKLFPEKEYGEKESDELSFKSATSAELSESAGSDESFKSIEIKNANDLIEVEEQSMVHNLAINSTNSPSQHSHSPKLLIAKEIRDHREIHSSSSSSKKPINEPEIQEISTNSDEIQVVEESGKLSGTKALPLPSIESPLYSKMDRIKMKNDAKKSCCGDLSKIKSGLTSVLGFGGPANYAEKLERKEKGTN